MKFNQAPLPFQGQKRNYLNKFKEELIKYPNNAIYVDLFGGSGLLSRTVKDVFPDARVIYNDFDNFRERINAIPNTNAILKDLRELTKGYTRKGKMPEQLKAKILHRLKQETGYVDYITLSSSLLFSMNYAATLPELEKQTFYNKIRLTDYKCDGYLNGLEVVSEDYKTLHAKFSNNKKVVFLVDPPYLSTDCTTYKDYWKLKDYLDVLKVLENDRYFYFTSNKSSIVELCEWMANCTMSNPFEYAYKTEMSAKTSHNTGYTDIMLHKGWETTIS